MAGASTSRSELAGLEPDAPRLEALVHDAAGELSWHFDLEAASARAQELGRPVLVYLRCLSGFEGRSSASHSIALPELELLDDGYAKDVLFRTAVLSDEDVADLIERRFVIVCSTDTLTSEDAQSSIDAGRLTTPALLVLTRIVCPEATFLTKMSLTALVSPATRLVALELKATNWPLLLIAGCETLPLCSAPLLSVLTREV